MNLIFKHLHYLYSEYSSFFPIPICLWCNHVIIIKTFQKCTSVVFTVTVVFQRDPHFNLLHFYTRLPVVYSTGERETHHSSSFIQCISLLFLQWGLWSLTTTIIRDYLDKMFPHVFLYFCFVFLMKRWLLIERSAFWPTLAKTIHFLVPVRRSK